MAQEKEPNWENSETLESCCWKNPLFPMADRLEMADGAVAWRDRCITNLRSQLKELRGEVK